MEYKLLRPTAEYEEKYWRLMAEPGANDEMMPYTTRPRGRAYAELLRDWSVFETAPLEGFVPGTAFFFVDGEGEILGFLDLRHRLNANLEKCGGHIGYGLRPSARGKGLAPKMLALGLEEARARGIQRVLLTCDKANLPSAATIRRCGGVLADELPCEEGGLTQRYWIEL